MTLRAWNGSEDRTSVQQLASRLWPRGLHPGGLGWAAAIEQLADRLVLADEDGVGGWAGLSSGEAFVQVDPGHPGAATSLLEWAVTEAGHDSLTLHVPIGDELLGTTAAEFGFDPIPGARAGSGMFRSATSDGPVLPTGYSIRSVGDDEWAERLAAHRAAWRPATLPWPPGPRPPVPEDATSSFTAPLYEEVRRTWLYDQSLDLVAVAPDGTMAACCIAWWDPSTGCAEIEPLGVVPEHRRRGLAGALCLEVADRVAAHGGETVFINTTPHTEYSVPAAAYAAVGFEVIDRDLPFHRPPT
jgi:GNAT superfamily N-acetyltransferase